MIVLYCLRPVVCWSSSVSRSVSVAWWRSGYACGTGSTRSGWSCGRSSVSEDDVPGSAALVGVGATVSVDIVI